MKVDIIMPTYNPDALIVESINSCLSQSYKDVKLTVIDDCSTQTALLDRLKQKYPNVNFLRTPKNLGPGGARNYGIAHTSGELISFLDDDDIMDRDKIFISVQEFKKNSKIGMTCGNYRIFVNGKVRKPFYSRAIEIDHRRLMKQNFVASGSVTIRRDVFEDVGRFNEEYWIAEDYDLWLRVSEKYPIKYIHRILYFYRVIPGGNSLTQRKDIQAKHITNLNNIKEASRKRMANGKNSN